MAESKGDGLERERRQAGPPGPIWVYIKSLGPGLVTGASDDDPSGIGTYSQTGAQFGYAQLWTSLVCRPLIRSDGDYLMNIVAILGTTITPYCFFWQASQEVDEQIDEGKRSPASRVGMSAADLKWMRSDVVSGMLVSQVISWFIIATTAATLHGSGVLSVDSAPKAAEALKPLAGNFA